MRDRQRQERIDASDREQIIDGIAAQHDESAMREIDDVEHAPDQRHAERHQAIETAQQDAVDEDLRENIRDRGSLRLVQRAISRRFSARSRRERDISAC